MRPIGEKERLHLFVNYGTEHNLRLFAAVKERYPDLSEAYEAAKKRSAAAFDFLTDHVRSRLFDAADDGFMDRYVAWLDRHGVGVTIPAHEEYPALLKQVPDPPSLLFYRGRLNPAPALPIAVVGARRSTKYGRMIAKSFSEQMANSGATVVSGLAAGIDSEAALGALSSRENEYPTIGVLGCGIDVVYPASNGPLYDQVAERGAVLTEYLPKSAPKREHFPFRNRIISGLSRGVLVVEAGERSGTSITVSYAHEQGRDVFAVPGRITDVASVGTNRLIQQCAAKPVFCVSDILSEYGIELRDEAGGEKPPAPQTVKEKAVCSLLYDGEKSFDELCEALPYSAAELNSCLTAMEFSGIMIQLPGRIYALCKKP